MANIDAYDFLFIIFAFLFQVILVVHFALRKWNINVAIRYGPIVYAFSLVAAAVSAVLFLAGKAWWYWLAGILYLAWAAYGYWVDYVRKIEWRVPFRWNNAGPYLLLYLATIMFYWFPLVRIWRPLWYVYGVLFILSTVLNLTSHKSPTNQ